MPAYIELLLPDSSLGHDKKQPDGELSAEYQSAQIQADSPILLMPAYIELLLPDSSLGHDKKQPDCGLSAEY